MEEEGMARDCRVSVEDCDRDVASACPPPVAAEEEDDGCGMADISSNWL